MVVAWLLLIRVVLVGFEKLARPVVVFLDVPRLIISALILFQGPADVGEIEWTGVAGPELDLLVGFV